MELQEFCKHDALRDWMNFLSPFKHMRIQVPVSCDQSSRGYYLRTSDDESYFPGRAAEIVAYGQVPANFLAVFRIWCTVYAKNCARLKKKCSGMTQTIFFNLARFFCGYCI